MHHKKYIYIHKYAVTNLHIIKYGIIKQHRILWHNSNTRSDRVLCIFLYIQPVQHDGPFDGVVEAEEEAGDSGLACVYVEYRVNNRI